jgi:hypothetical protein
MLTLLMLSFTEVFSQKIQVTPFSGYTFGNRFSIEGGRAEISGGHTWGGAVSIPLPSDFSLEFLYSRHMTTVSAASINLSESIVSDAAYNYFLAGVNRNFIIPNSGLKLYGGTKIGASVLSSLDDGFSTRTNFAVSIGAGLVYLINDFAGLHLGANVKAPVLGSGINLWWGTGSGPQVGVSSWAPIVQFNLLGGIVLIIGK